MNLYIDESGSITTSDSFYNRYFVISFVEVKNEKKAVRVFRRAKKNFIKHNPQYGLDVKEEIKGSEMPHDMKIHIFNELKQKTDIDYSYMIFDNQMAENRLRKKPSIAFNYLLKLRLNRLLKHRKVDTLNLHVDNRNNAVYGLNSLQDYLEIQYVFEKHKTDEVNVTYHESFENELIQIADIFANTVFRMCKYSNAKKEYPKNLFLESNEIHEMCSPMQKEFFPYRYCDFEFIH